MTTPPEQGDCFAVAAGQIFDGPHHTLVHGWAAGTTGGPLEGRRFWHAWIETTEELEVEGCTEPFAVEIVIDRANGKDLRTPKALYYQAGQIERTWRYTTEEAVFLMLQTQHYGPWADENPEGNE